MIKAEPHQDLQYPFRQRPDPGEALTVRPGIHWLRMPMPFVLNHINLWVLEGPDGWTVIDTGLRTVDVAAAWNNLLAPEGALGGRRVARVVVTHMHPDHVGMAGWLTRRFDCPFHMTRLEYLNCRVMVADTGREAPPDGLRFYARAGWSERDLDHYRMRFGEFGKMIHPLPDSFERLTDGQVLRLDHNDWEVIVARGHSPEHACLYCRELDVLISGDQILPKITSNTSVYPIEPSADPIGDWLTSIEDIRRRVPDSVLVLPAHNDPFLGLHLRLQQLHDSTLLAMGRVRQALTEPRRVIDLVREVFPSPIANNPTQLGLATGETIAHLNYLSRQGHVRVERREDADWYRLA